MKRYTVERINIVKMTNYPVGRVGTDRSLGSLQIESILHQNTNGIFHRNRTNNSKMYMKTQKTLNNVNNLEREQS